MSGHRRALRTRLISCVHTRTSKLRARVSQKCDTSCVLRFGLRTQLRVHLRLSGLCGYFQKASLELPSDRFEQIWKFLWALTCPPHAPRCWLICAFVRGSCRRLSSSGPWKVRLYEVGSPIAGFTEDGCPHCCWCDVSSNVGSLKL